MGGVEGRAIAGESFGEVGGHDPTFIGGVIGDGFVEDDSLGDADGHFEGIADLVGGLEEGFFVLLHVAVVGEREALHGEEQGIEGAEDPAGLASDEFEGVGVFLLRHEAGAGGDAVAQFEPAEFFRRVEDPIFRQAAEVDHGDGGRVEVVEGEVAVGGDVHRVIGDGGEAEVAGDGVTVMREAAAGEGSGAEGHDVGAAAGFGEALVVAGKHLEVGEEVVGPEDGLGAAEVGVAGDDGVGVLFGEVEERGEQGLDQRAGAVAFVAEPEAGIEGDLFVAGTPGVDFAGQGAHPFAQLADDEGVDVFVGGSFEEVGVVRVRLDGVEGGDDGGAFGFG